MLIRGEIEVGVLLAQVLDGKNIGGWPGSQEWADEAEAILAFLKEHGQLETFLKPMRGKENQREGAFAHGRAAMWLAQHGYRITGWEPDATGHPGDLEFDYMLGRKVFAEVKFRTWQSELSEEEIRAGRAKLPPFINGEVHSFDSHDAVIGAIEKACAMTKFKSDRPNLLIIGDGQRVPIGIRLHRQSIADALGDPRYDPIGAVLILEAVVYCGKPLEYRTLYFDNPRALGEPWQIPIDVATNLEAWSCDK